MHEFQYLWLIPFLPLAGSLLIRLMGKRFLPRRAVHAIACTTVGASFVISVVAFLRLRALEADSLVDGVFPWIRVGTFEVWARFVFDPLSSVMALIVGFVGFLIHVYSTGYMAHDKGYERFFAYMNLFMGMMFLLVLADSLLLMFVGWEGVGLCSYLLIGFWFQDKANADAGKKAFIVNRIGDFGFLLGIFTLFWALGIGSGVWSLDFDALRGNLAALSGQRIFGIDVVTFSTLCLFVGAAGKSAQIPLYVWLPDAMAGPTPVSALIHAATMVTAGVYMIARLSFLFDLAPITLCIVATVGAATAAFAASMALVQNDLKKILAYSTISQLGYMFLACGVGAYAAGIFHLTTHAFFKALLFLCAGSVIHALGGEQDIRNMGGLRRKIPRTYRAALVATLAIAGIPPLAGFFSKDAVLWEALTGPGGHWGFYALALMTAALTAFYMFRLLFLTFFGTCRLPAGAPHVHESPPSMLIPLEVLAVLSIAGGWLWFPGFMPLIQAFPDYLSAGGAVVFHASDGQHHALEAALAVLSVLAALGAIFAAWVMYLRRPDLPRRLAGSLPGIHRTLVGRYGVDEAYNATFVRGTLGMSRISSAFDSFVVDGAVNALAKGLKVLSFLDGVFDRIFVDGLVNAVGHVTRALGRGLGRLQTGQVQSYLATLAAGLLLISLFWLSFVIGS